MKTLSPDDLERIGRVLYGQQWHTAMAENLNVTYRTICRWMAGTSNIPLHVRQMAIATLKLNAAEIATLINELEG